MSGISERDFGRLEEKVDNVIALLKERHNEISKLEDRVSAVERRQYTWGGGLAVLTVLFSKLDFTSLFK